MRDNISSGALTETTLLVLLALYKELHGYGVKLFIEEKTDGRVVLGMGTLYGAIKNLAEKGWIVESGKEQVKKEEKRLQELQLLIKNIRGK